MNTDKFRIDSGNRKNKKTVRNDDGTAVLTGLPVFRVGTFTSTNGKTTEYTLADLKLIADNFETLSQGPVPNVPVRADHGNSINAVVGYVDDLYVKGKALQADVTFTEPDAADKWDRGTFRNRSSEIGTYRTNEGEVFDKAFVGFAFVDFGAVEQLDNHYSLSNSTAGDTTKVFTQEDIDAAKAEGHKAGEVAGHKAGLAEGMANAFAASPGQIEVAKFSISGAETEDAEAVQAHIDDLESKVNDFARADRKAFVKTLSDSGRIMASKFDDVLEQVLAFDAHGFEQFKAIQEFSAPLAAFDGSEAGNTNDKDQDLEEVSEKALYTQILEGLEKAGVSQEDLEQTEQFRKLQKLEGK